MVDIIRRALVDNDTAVPRCELPDFDRDEVRACCVISFVLVRMSCARVYMCVCVRVRACVRVCVCACEFVHVAGICVLASQVMLYAGVRLAMRGHSARQRAAQAACPPQLL